MIDAWDRVAQLFDGTRGVDDMDIKTFRLEIKKAAELAEDDPELGHIVADNLMAQTLEALWYGDGVKIFRGMERNYGPVV